MKRNRLLSFVLAVAVNVATLSGLLTEKAYMEAPTLGDWTLTPSYTEGLDYDQSVNASSMRADLLTKGWSTTERNDAFTKRDSALSFEWNRFVQYSASSDGVFYYTYKIQMYNSTEGAQLVKLIGENEYTVLSSPVAFGSANEYTTVVDAINNKAYTYKVNDGTLLSEVDITGDTITAIKFQNTVNTNSNNSFWIFDFSYGIDPNRQREPEIAKTPSSLSYWTLEEGSYIETFDFAQDVAAKDMRQELISKGWATTERDDALTKRDSAVSFEWNRFAQYNNSHDGFFYYEYNIQMYNSAEGAQLVILVGEKGEYQVLSSPAATSAPSRFTTIIDPVNSLAYTYNSSGDLVTTQELQNDTIGGIKFYNTVNTNTGNAFCIYDFTFGVVDIDTTVSPDDIILKSNDLNNGEALVEGDTYNITAASFTDKTVTFEEPVAVLEDGKIPVYAKTSLEISMADGTDFVKGISVSGNGLNISSALAPGGYDIIVVAKALYSNSIFERKYNLHIEKNQVTPDEIMNDYKPVITSGDSIINDGAKVKENLVLPESNNIMTIKWDSDNTSVISNEGIVKRPLEDTVVKLEVTIISTEDTNRSKTLVYNLTVKGVGAMLKDAIEKAKSALVSADDNEKVMDGSELSALDEDIKLYTSYTNEEFEDYKGVVYAWESDSEALKISDDVAEIYPAEIKIYPVKLTVKASYGSTYLTEEIPVTVNLNPENPGDNYDKYAVRCDDIAPENFKGIKEYDGKTVSDDITVPTKGIFGSTISWTSSVPMYLSNTGKYNTPKKDTNAVLSGVVSKGSVLSGNVHTFKFTIDAKGSSSSSSSSGGSGGGGGGSYYVTMDSLTQDTPIINTSPATQTERFFDLASVLWAKEAINALADRGIVSGKGDKIFAPNDNITRAEFAKMVVDAFGFKSTKKLDAFTDVNEGEWHYTFIAAAYENGIINGYDNATFGAGDNITRQDMAVILYRALTKAGYTLERVDAGVVFEDNESIQDYAKDAVLALAEADVINGISENEFAPLENATRAAAAKMIYEIIK